MSPENQPTSKLKKKTNNTESAMIDEPKLSAYDVNWFNTTSLKKECLKYTLEKNLSVTQEGQLLPVSSRCVNMTGPNKFLIIFWNRVSGECGVGYHYLHSKLNIVYFQIYPE